MVKETGFAKIHVFRFSPRKNTPASRMKNFIDTKIINHRSEIMLELDKKSGYDFRNNFLGKTETILIENSKKQLSGRSERYFMVYLNTKEDTEHQFKKNDIVKVILLKNTIDGMYGVPADKGSL